MALDLTEEWNKVADTQLITGVTVVRKEYAEEHPDVVAAFPVSYTHLHHRSAGGGSLPVRGASGGDQPARAGRGRGGRDRKSVV